MNAHLVEWSIRAGLMAAGTAAVLRILRIRGAAARHAAWTAMLVFMLLMPAWTAWGPKVAVRVLPEAGPLVLESILPEERQVYNEQALAILGTDLLKEYTQADIDYM